MWSGNYENWNAAQWRRGFGGAAKSSRRKLCTGCRRWWGKAGAGGGSFAPPETWKNSPRRRRVWCVSLRMGAEGDDEWRLRASRKEKLTIMKRRAALMSHRLSTPRTAQTSHPRTHNTSYIHPRPNKRYIAIHHFVFKNASSAETEKRARGLV